MYISPVIGFAAVTFVAVVTPGPDVILAMANGSQYGFRRAVPGFVAVLCSDLLMISGVAAGLGTMLMTSAFWFLILKYLGSAYLFFLGLKLMLAKGAWANVAPTEQRVLRLYSGSIAWRSFIVAITNPKAYLFFAALLPQFIDPGQPLGRQYLHLGVTFAAVEFAVMAGYAFAGRRLSGVFSSRHTVWIERGCGGGLMASAIALFFARRVVALA